MSLADIEAAADRVFGFPSGTLNALGVSESGNGANTGTLGNIFQVTPATASNPGYGLSSVNGNDPMSVGAYLSALQGANGGNLGAALYQYQGAGVAGNPTTPNSGLSGFLATNGLTYAPSGSGAPGSTSQAATPAGGSSPSGQASTASTACSWTSPACWFSTAGSYLANFASRGALIVLAIILLLGAVYLFAQRTQMVTQST